MNFGRPSLRRKNAQGLLGSGSIGFGCSNTSLYIMLRSSGEEAEEAGRCVGSRGLLILR